MRKAAIALGALTLASPAAAEEGFWTFDNPPLARLREAGFSPSPEWLERMRLSSLRFMDGGSGAFVSKDGLMATNHHVALECLQNLSTKEKDLVNTGFSAGGPRARAEVSRLRGERPRQDRRRDRPRAPGGDPGHVGQGGGRRTQGGERPAPQRMRGGDRPALRHGEPVPGGRVPPLRLQDLQRRAAGLCPRAGDRLLRGRPRQLHLPAPRLRRVLLPGLRERAARGAPGLPALVAPGHL